MPGANGSHGGGNANPNGPGRSAKVDGVAWATGYRLRTSKPSAACSGASCWITRCCMTWSRSSASRISTEMRTR